MTVRACGVDLHWLLSMRGVFGMLGVRSFSMIATCRYVGCEVVLWSPVDIESFCRSNADSIGLRHKLPKIGIGLRVRVRVRVKVNL